MFNNINCDIMLILAEINIIYMNGENIMIIISTILILLGIAFISFGYAIYFKKKYNLINNYKINERNGKLDKNYAQMVGKIELFGGFSCIFFGLLSILINSVLWSILFLLLNVAVICIALIINQVKSTQS
jgi:phosphatidylglycerophosphate synthase